VHLSKSFRVWNVNLKLMLTNCLGSLQCEKSSWKTIIKDTSMCTQHKKTWKTCGTMNTKVAKGSNGTQMLNHTMFIFTSHNTDVVGKQCKSW